MTGDPKVLAPLQRAYLAATNAKVLQRIQIVWDFETSGKIVNNDADADAEIRAWTPPPAEPSLEQRVEALELFAKDSTGDIVRLNERAFKLEQQAKQEEQDDPVAVPVARWNGRRLDDLCACGHSWGKHFGEHRCGECDCAQFIPEPTAPDDPVCAREGCGHKRSDHEQGIGLPRFPTNCKRCSCSSFIPAPQPAPDLDPVRVEAAAKAVYATRGWGPLEEANYGVQRMWTDDAAIAIKHYLKDGGA